MIGSDSVIIVHGKGSVYPEDLRVGDLVLTHKGHWRAVSSIEEKTAPRLWVLHYKGCNINSFVTPEHEVLTLKRWTQVQNLQAHDKIAVFNGAIIYEPVGLVHDIGGDVEEHKVYEIHVTEDDSFAVNNMIVRENGTTNTG